MTKHWRYLLYVLRHKWFVFLACASEGLILRGILHDWHKFLPSEWPSYAEYFYGTKRQTEWFGLAERFGCAEAAPWGECVGDWFNLAWLRHQKRGDHHWQAWMLHKDDGGVFPIPMSPRARLEMLCDWKGAGRAQGKTGGWKDTAAWYADNWKNMVLHQETREWVEAELARRAKETTP